MHLQRRRDEQAFGKSVGRIGAPKYAIGESDPLGLGHRQYAVPRLLSGVGHVLDRQPMQQPIESGHELGILLQQLERQWRHSGREPRLEFYRIELPRIWEGVRRRVLCGCHCGKETEIVSQQVSFGDCPQPVRS